LNKITEKMKDVSEQAETAEPLLAKELYDTLRKTTQAGTGKTLEMSQQLAQRGNGDGRVPIPQTYATELQTVIRALGEMKQPADNVKWLQAGTQGVGVRFPNDEKTRTLKLKIEELLGTTVSSSKPTQTI